MLNIHEVLNVIEEVDVLENHELFTCKFSKGEYLGLGTLQIENKNKPVSIRIIMTASLKGTSVGVFQWKRGNSIATDMVLTEEEHRVLIKALNPIFEDECFMQS